MIKNFDDLIALCKKLQEDENYITIECSSEQYEALLQLTEAKDKPYINAISGKSADGKSVDFAIKIGSKVIVIKENIILNLSTNHYFILK